MKRRIRTLPAFVLLSSLAVTHCGKRDDVDAPKPEALPEAEQVEDNTVTGPETGDTGEAAAPAETEAPSSETPVEEASAPAELETETPASEAPAEEAPAEEAPAAEIPEAPVQQIGDEDSLQIQSEVDGLPTAIVSRIEVDANGQIVEGAKEELAYITGELPSEDKVAALFEGEQNLAIASTGAADGETSTQSWLTGYSDYRFGNYMYPYTGVNNLFNNALYGFFNPLRNFGLGGGLGFGNQWGYGSQLGYGNQFGFGNQLGWGNGLAWQNQLGWHNNAFYPSMNYWTGGFPFQQFNTWLGSASFIPSQWNQGLIYPYIGSNFFFQNHLNTRYAYSFRQPAWIF